MAHDISEIPVLSLAAMPEVCFAGDLGRSFRTFGFAIISDHGIDEALLSCAWSLTRAFFSQPAHVKEQYHIKEGAGQRGYTPFGKEIAKGAHMSDLKEFWQIGREQGADGTLPEGMMENVWPKEIEGFRACFSKLYDEFDRVGVRLLSAIALDLGLPADWFSAPTREGNSILRLLHYPPLGHQDDAGVEGAVRAGAHEDINLITLLLGAEEAGLQLLDQSGNWINVLPPKGALVVNIGDMLQRLTNHMFPSTTHRVINPSADRMEISRYSMPFFLHLRPDFVIDAIPQCISAASPRRYPAIRALDYLQERLREIGLLTA